MIFRLRFFFFSRVSCSPDPPTLPPFSLSDFTQLLSFFFISASLVVPQSLQPANSVRTSPARVLLNWKAVKQSVLQPLLPPEARYCPCQTYFSLVFHSICITATFVFSRFFQNTVQFTSPFKENFFVVKRPGCIELPLFFSCHCARMLHFFPIFLSKRQCKYASHPVLYKCPSSFRLRPPNILIQLLWSCLAPVPVGLGF